MKAGQSFLAYITTRISICFLLSGITTGNLHAQCTSTISTFPYTENFELSDGGWTTGGFASGWTWGAPNKTVIKNPIGGASCWGTDGLTKTAYAGDEQSWVQSPCFDFTSLAHPYITAEIFWETELGFDGANLQYSTDAGATWNIAGNPGQSPCLDAQLYNSAVRYLPYGVGWSGSTISPGGSCAVGGGSGTWVTTKMYLPQLAGLKNVRFRFFFGAGHICNNYDGFAFDDFTIYEAPPSTADFTYSCAGNQTIDFVNTASCPSSLSWNFGDPLSGTSNTSSINNPSHTFSAGGKYDVTLTVTDGQGIITSITKQVSVITLSNGGIVNVSCNGGNDGSATVIVTGPPDTYIYAWNTVPPQSAAAAVNLAKGQYTVSVSSSSCTESFTFSIDEPSPFHVDFTVQDATCGNSNGSVLANISGGTGPYILNWSPIAGNNPQLSNIDSGKYFIDINDKNNCTYKDSVLVNDISDFKISLGADTSLCPGDAFTISPGNNFAEYLWQDGSAASSFNIIKDGLYWVNVKNADGCTASDSIKIISDCGEIFFPTAFTPNGDFLNDLFGPVGNLAAIKNYTLTVYDRWGNIVFSSTNPFVKWDGFTKNRMKNNGATFVWFAQYDYREQKNIQRKGTVTEFF